MTLTKKELIQRLMDGEKLVPVASRNNSNKIYCYYDENSVVPFQLKLQNGDNTAMVDSWKDTEWEVYEEEEEEEVPTFFEPEDGKEAYYLGDNGNIFFSSCWKNSTDIQVISQGNVFKTAEEAEKEANLRAVKYRVKKRIWELNGGEFIEFNYAHDNWSFSLGDKIGVCNTLVTKCYPNWQYLKTEKLVKQLIDEMYDDLLLIRSE